MHGQQNIKKWPNQINFCFLINPILQGPAEIPNDLVT